ncbi:uncharacterized protein H6S33_008722 [Morchella sextelata]|uniref:uncharacterized protein n=1 Tax=Morchella sextelata TaxID=1174677 RepID=UPI001D0455BE|nr:uncharacterized protein H6S33_008722 [Morchella sextelata]KAH0602383.1 hypothetical protein H6S33_008722 [Morchella sextelata]
MSSTTALSSSSRWHDLALHPSPNNRFLVDNTGAPFFWLADTAWELFHALNSSEVDTYLSDRASKGYTVIQAVAIAENDGLVVPNRNGDLPLVDADPTRPVEAYFDYIDEVVDKAWALGMRVALVPTWGRYVSEGYHGPPVIFDEDNAKVFGEYIGKRYAGLPKILGGDSNRYWGPWLELSSHAKPTLDQDISMVAMTDTGAVWSALANGIRTHEGPAAFLTYHSTVTWLAGTPSALASSFFGHEPWLTMDAVQSGHNIGHDTYVVTTPPAGSWVAMKNYEPVEIMYSRVPARPVIDLENHYEDWPGINGQRWNASLVRNGAWHAVFAGAAGHVYGCHPMWQFYDPARNASYRGAKPTRDWQTALSFDGAGQMGHVRRFIEDRSTYFTRVPDQSIVTSYDWDSVDRVSGTRDSGGKWLAVYSPRGVPFMADTTKLVASGRLAASWYDPRNGTYTAISGPVERRMNVTFRPPSTGTTDNDWVLLVEA